MEVLNFSIHSSVSSSFSSSTFLFSSRIQDNHTVKASTPSFRPPSFLHSVSISASLGRARLNRGNSLRKKLSEIIHGRRLPPQITEDPINVFDVQPFDFEQRNDVVSGVASLSSSPNCDQKSKNTPIGPDFDSQCGQGVDFRAPMNNGALTAKSGHNFTGTDDKNSRNSMERALDTDMELDTHAAENITSSVEVVSSSGKHGIFTHAFVPKLGMVILCPCFLLWTAKLLLKRVKGGGKKMTAFEKEMVRRKMKAMAEKEIMRNTGVELVQHSNQATVKPITRPQINNHELLRTISRAKMGSDPFSLEDEEDLDIHRNRNDSNPAMIEGEAKGDHSRAMGGARERTLGGENSSFYVRNVELEKKNLGPDIDVNSIPKGIPIGCSENIENPEAIATESSELEQPTKVAKNRPRIDDPAPGKQREESPVETADIVHGHEGRYSKQEHDTVVKGLEYSKEHSRIAEKICKCYKNNYELAKKRVKEGSNQCYTFDQIRSILNGEKYGLGWEEDDDLKDIILKVKENELAGLDPFHAMKPEDKTTYFKGIDKKIEKVNSESLMVHEFLHENLANLDAEDGSMPYWKGSPAEGYELMSMLEKLKEEFSLTINPAESADRSLSSDRVAGTSISTVERRGRAEESPRTVIEGSDGSSKAGKRSGKEQWAHTKKWSRRFWEFYNSQTDPETKAALREAGRDLDRWETEEELEEEAKKMDEMYLAHKDFYDKSLEKIRRETMLFGSDAVLDKYREYDRDCLDGEDDPLWWLDLPHITCIEMYTEKEEKRGEYSKGLYSLAMAPDLNLKPQPYHIIAFENPGDGENFCLIVDAHLQTLGTGLSTVVSLLPKELYRDVRAKGYNVTVIKNGGVEMNVDVELGDVESQIIDIGSEVYHKQSIAGTTINIHSLVRGALSP